MADPPGTDAFRAAVERKDLDAMIAALAPNVVFHSPVTFKPFVGREVVGVVLGAVLKVFEDFTYTDELVQGNVRILVFKARVGDRDVEGLDLLRAGADGQIEDFTVMVRPLSGVQALARAMGERLGPAPSHGA
jgi:SnoaL-like protein